MNSFPKNSITNSSDKKNHFSLKKIHLPLDKRIFRLYICRRKYTTEFLYKLLFHKKIAKWKKKK